MDSLSIHWQHKLKDHSLISKPKAKDGLLWLIPKPSLPKLNPQCNDLKTSRTKNGHALHTLTLQPLDQIWTSLLSTDIATPEPLPSTNSKKIKDGRPFAVPGPQGGHPQQLGYASCSSRDHSGALWSIRGFSTVWSSLRVARVVGILLRGSIRAYVCSGSAGALLRVAKQEMPLLGEPPKGETK